MHYVLFIYYSHMITVFVVSFDMCHLNNVGVKTLVNLGRRTGALLNTIRPLPPIQGWYGFFILTPVWMCVAIIQDYRCITRWQAAYLQGRYMIPDFATDVPKQLNNISSDNICEGSLGCCSVHRLFSVPSCKIERLCHIQTIPSH
jgi:hypothetical protein